MVNIDIGPNDDTSNWLRILANQIDNDDAPDFFLVTSLGNGSVDYTWRTQTNVLELLGAIEVKLHELKQEIVFTKEAR